LHRYCNNWSNSTHYFFVLIPDCSSAVANDGLLDPAGPGKLMKSELIEAAVMALFACKEDAWLWLCLLPHALQGITEA